MRKILMGALAGAMAMGMLAGCSGGAPSATSAAGTDTEGTSAAASQSGSGETKTLEVVWFNDGKEGESFLRLADQYMEENPDVKIELIEVPFADLDNKLRNMINAGEAPAMARITNLGIYKNQLLDLSQYVSDGEEFKNNFGSGLKYLYDGKMLAAPMEVTANGIIYNKTAFEKAGVSVPLTEDEIWTWDEFEEALKTVMEKGGVKYGMAFDFSGQRLSTLIYEAGGSLLNQDLTASNINTDATREALTWFKKLHDEGVIPTSVWLGSENPNEMFRTGQVATHFAGSWMISNYKEQITDFEWGVTYLPRDATRATVPGGKWIGAFQGSGVEQEAADFIRWISQPEQNAQYCMDNYFLSQVKGNESLDYDYGAQFFEIFSNELEATDPHVSDEWGFQEFTNVIQPELRTQTSEMLAGNITVDQLVETMDQLAKDTLSELE